MHLQKRKGTVDGYEWRCRNQSKDNHHDVVRSDEVEKLAYQLNEEAEWTERPIRRLSKVMYGSTCADMQVDVMGECLSSIKHVVGSSELLTASFHDFGDNFKQQEQLSGGSVVVVHEEPHPQMTGTLSYRPEETVGKAIGEIARYMNRRLDDRHRVLPRPEDCTAVVCLHDCTGVPLTPAHRKAFSVVPGTPELETQ
ncbi:uncharacterized protein TNCV_118531 [Trichonephila clavipes]|nr:uncharacterized protein TNCV_118531 [Trichonephila clavipes]